MSEETKQYDEDYVKNLRSEAANYRTQVRDLESKLKGFSELEGQVRQVRVENELVRRGITAEPSWIEIGDKQTPTEAVDAWLTKYPQFAPQTQPQQELQTPIPKEIPSALPPQEGKANVPGLHTVFGGRTLQEIEADPVARATLGKFYRQNLPHMNED